MGHVLIKGLSKYFVERRKGPRLNTNHHVGERGNLLVIDDIDLEFLDGELVCILGPSGCGKTTLLHIMAGFDTPTSGSVIIDGKRVTGPSSDNIFVFQHCALLPWMTVWENVSLGLRNVKDMRSRAEEAQNYIDMVNLSGSEHRYPHQLSGGMQRRAELARALVVNPEILFMDEPFAGLDSLTRLNMREEILEMHNYFGKTIIFITHSIDEALVMADRVVVFTDLPAKAPMDMTLDFPHPRDIHEDPELADLRRKVYKDLGVHHAL